MRALFLFLLLLGSLHAITLNVPANASTLQGAIQTFNWSTDDIACTEATLTISKGAQVWVNLAGLPCNGTQNISNLTLGNYTWQVSNDAPETSSLFEFELIPLISTAITAPISGTYGMWVSNCHHIVSVQTNVSGTTDPATETCRLYSSPSNIDLNWSLIDTKTGSGAFNFTIPTDGATLYRVNCTASVGSYSADTQTEQYELLGTSFCTNGELDESPNWAFLSLVILGGGFIYMGVEGDDV